MRQDERSWIEEVDPFFYYYYCFLLIYCTLHSEKLCALFLPFPYFPLGDCYSQTMSEFWPWSLIQVFV